MNANIAKLFPDKQKILYLNKLAQKGCGGGGEGGGKLTQKGLFFSQSIIKKQIRVLAR